MSTTLKASPRPLPIRLFNGTGRLMSQIGLAGEISVEALLRKSRKQTGLKDFGDDAFLEPLSRLIRSINEEARLHAFGKFITKIRLVGILSNKLIAEYHFKKHPEILEQELDPLLIITGLQRTGTTKLQRLLAADPQARSLKSWEALNPAPPMPGKKDNRIRQAKQSENGLRYIAPDFFRIHPVEHLAPEEEVLLIDTSFISTVPEATLHVPSFADWVEKQDQTPAYEQMKRMLLLLQWQERKKWWVLKTPHHLEFLDTLFKVFPETKVIQTHRNPSKTLPSFCSMVYHSRRIFSDEVNAEEVGQHWLRKTGRMVDRAMDYRKSGDNRRFVDIAYLDLISDPMGEVQKIYSFAGKELTPEAISAMQAMLKVDEKDKHGRHHYHLDDFGLDRDQVGQVYADYVDRHLNASREG